MSRETPAHERLFEVTEVGADVRSWSEIGLHRRRPSCPTLRIAQAQLGNVLQVEFGPILSQKSK